MASIESSFWTLAAHPSAAPCREARAVVPQVAASRNRLRVQRPLNGHHGFDLSIEHRAGDTIPTPGQNILFFERCIIRGWDRGRVDEGSSRPA